MTSNRKVEAEVLRAFTVHRVQCTPDYTFTVTSAESHRLVTRKVINGPFYWLAGSSLYKTKTVPSIESLSCHSTSLNVRWYLVPTPGRLKLWTPPIETPTSYLSRDSTAGLIYPAQGLTVKCMRVLGFKSYDLYWLSPILFQWGPRGRVPLSLSLSLFLFLPLYKLLVKW